ncbi:hypothetical protein ACET3X_002078 [Alternaria dauci]|uniref:alpha-L-rhamnosidase n=1 Tax=Alternaria dauci TaxID=48095 RepID=A0ABR3UZ48_9PLEO
MVPPFTTPVVPITDLGEPAAVWGDIVVANPYNYYRAFGDLGMLAEQYDSAKAWIDKGISRNEVGLWNRTSYNFGDWLDPKSPYNKPSAATTNTYFVADLYLLHVTRLLSNISTILGHGDAAGTYEQQFVDLLQEFRKAWVFDFATLANRTQTAYGLAIYFDLFPDAQEAEEPGLILRKIVEENDYLVGTGFAGTPSLGPALKKIGAADDFYKMLLQTKTPSCLYQVIMNGTTTWERWDSLLPNATVAPGGMTSFNHYSFGSVASWIHTNIGGLEPAEPGWKRVSIAPIPGGNITFANSRYLSPYGEVTVRWHFELSEELSVLHRNGFYLEVRLPPNTKGTVIVSRGREGEVLKFSDPVDVGSGYHSWFVPGYNSP